MVGTIITIILGVLIVLFCYAIYVVSSECEKWKQECRKEQKKKGSKK